MASHPFSGSGPGEMASLPRAAVVRLLPPAGESHNSDGGTADPTEAWRLGWVLAQTLTSGAVGHVPLSHLRPLELSGATPVPQAGEEPAVPVTQPPRAPAGRVLTCEQLLASGAPLSSPESVLAVYASLGARSDASRGLARLRADFDAGGPGELTAAAGEAVQVLPEQSAGAAPRGWARVLLRRGGATETGYLPATYLELLPQVSLPAHSPLAASSRPAYAAGLGGRGTPESTHRPSSAPAASAPSSSLLRWAPSPGVFLGGGDSPTRVTGGAGGAFVFSALMGTGAAPPPPRQYQHTLPRGTPGGGGVGGLSASSPALLGRYSAMAAPRLRAYREPGVLAEARHSLLRQLSALDRDDGSATSAAGGATAARGGSGSLAGSPGSLAGSPYTYAGLDATRRALAEERSSALTHLRQLDLTQTRARAY